MLHRFGAGVLQQILAGDADVDGATADIHGDVERAQIEQLHRVVLVLDDKLARVGAQTIPCLGEHVPGRLGQHAFVRYCDSQHDIPYSPCWLAVV